MTREKILRLIKGLNKFCLDDLLLTSEEDEKTILEFLNEFIKQGCVKKLADDSYLFITYKKQEPTKKPDFTEERELQLYAKIENVSGKNLMTLSKELKNEFPDIKVHYENLINIKNKYSLNKVGKTRKFKHRQKPQKRTIKFTTAANKFLDSGKNFSLKKSTFFTYKTYVNNHLIPFFQSYTCQEITEKVWKEFTEQKLREGRKIQTINKMLLILKQIAKTYDPDNIICRRNRTEKN